MARKRSRALRRAALFALVALVLANALALGAPPSAAAALPGEIDHVEIETSSRNQGLGGPVTVTATLYVASDPHRTLSLDGLNLTLDHGSGFRLVEGENPRLFASLQVPSSSDFFKPSFVWALNASQVGDYTLTVLVASASGGSGRASADVSVRVGPVLGKITLQPGSPTTSSALTFAVPASTGFDDPAITLNVTLYVFQSPWTPKPLSATGPVLRLQRADKTPWHEIGSGVPMSSENGSYTYASAPVGRGSLVYWVYAQTIYGSVTSSPTLVFIEDPGVTTGVFWGAVGSVTAVLAGAFFTLLYDPYGQRPARGSLHNSPDRVRVSLVILGAGAGILALAAASGAAAGLWRWFGYL